MCVRACVFRESSLLFPDCVVTCSGLLYVPPEDPALLFTLKSCLVWSESWTLCLAAPPRDAGSSWIHSDSLINSSAGWIEMERYRQWKEGSMFQKHPPLSGNPLLIVFIASKNTSEPVTRQSMIASIFLSLGIWSGVHVHQCLPKVDRFELAKDELKKEGISSLLCFKRKKPFYLLLGFCCTNRTIKLPSTWMRPFPCGG